jgi:hypothetical protein
MICKITELHAHSEIHRQLIAKVQHETENLASNSDYRDIGIKSFKSTRKFVISYAIMITTSTFNLLLYPLLAAILTNHLMLSVNLELPWTNHKDFNGWIINYCYSCFYASQTGLFVLGYDLLFFIYVFYIDLRFALLKKMLKDIGDFDADEKQHELILKCSKAHAEIME